MRQNNYQGAIQNPLGFGFNTTSAASDVIKGISLKGKIAIITGENTGTGLEITITLVGAGATVIVPAKDVEKVKNNLQGIQNMEIESMDIIDPATYNFYELSNNYT